MSLIQVIALYACGHACVSLSAAAFIFSARLAIMLPSECPELRGDSAGTSTRLVASFFAASKVTAAAFVWIWCLSDPREKALLSVNLRNRRGTDLDSPILPTIGRRRN
jgi:hypothetical protein